MSLRAWLILKLIPLVSRAYRDPANLGKAIAANRQKGPAAPSKGVQKFARFTQEQWDGTLVWRLSATGHAPKPLRFFYLHGGAFAFHIQAGQWNLPAQLLRRLGGEAITPLYPLAPEHGWQVGQEAVLRTYLRLVAQYGPDNIVLLGDSAGGGLALSLAQQLRDSGGPMPAAMALFSPWLDLALKGADQPEIEKADPSLSIAFLRAAGVLWAGQDRADDPRISPLFASQEALPPTIVLSGTRDILDSDALRLAKANSAVNLKHYVGMFHVWPAAPIPEAKQALDETAEFLRRALQLASSNR